MTLSNYHIAVKMLTKAFTAYIEVLRNYTGFYDSYSRAFEDYLSALPTS